MAYVNYLGDEIGLVDHGTRKKAKKDETSFHKGWRVLGIPPGALEAAEKQHPILIADAISWNERVARGDTAGKALPVPGPWDAERWMNEVKKTAVRLKPYEIPEAARECKALALRGGWLRVEIEEVKKEITKGGA